MREQKPLEQRSCVKARFLGMIGVVESTPSLPTMSHIKQTLRQAGYLFRPSTIIYLVHP